jgi:membrane carboxypeptidase/penicillin-binding protein
MAAAEKEKLIAPESEKTRKVREKLMKAWEEEKKQITPSAIKSTIDKIHQWIADNAKDRVLIREKRLRLFDEKENAVEISKKVKIFAEKLQEDMKHFVHLREKDS